MKKAKIIALLAAASMVTLTGCKGTPDTMGGDLAEQLIEQDKAAANAGKDVDIHNFIMPEIGEKIAVINVKDYGTIKIKLFPEDAEKGVENFVGLAEMGYYDELIFHRIIPSFMNQGGDPRGDGTGGKSIWGESFDGGTDENLYHFTGAVAYANSGSTSTNGSQFYIVNTPDGYMQYSCDELMASDPSYYWPDNVVEKYNEVGGVPFLDGGYTVFGQVFEGMDVVRAMAQVETNPDTDKPLTQIMMENVEIVEYTGPSTTSSDSSVSDTAANDTADSTVEQEQTAAAVEDVEIHNFDMPENGEKIAVVNVKDFGTIKIKLFPEDAEKGVENFVGLAESGYYNGLIFHRIIPEFMNQGGDPNGNGTGGQSIWGDSFDGGTDENLYHFTGAVAYANSGATSTNGSQFYIVNTPDGYMQYSCEVLSANDPAYSWPANVVEKYNEVGGTPFLDGSYTVFGQVFEGMDVVRAMAEVETDAMDKPLTDIVIESIEIVEYTN